MKILPVIQQAIISSKNSDNLTFCRTKHPTKLLSSPHIHKHSYNPIPIFLQHAQDIAYKKQLLNNAGININIVSRLSSILSGNIIRKVLTDLNKIPQSYILGPDLENTENGRYCANLHIHTTNSDGMLTVQDLLDKAAEYGNYTQKTTGKPFIIAITDHDTTEGIEEATKILAKNPEKYKNLRVIMGAEITIFENVTTDIIDSPVNPHILVYGINPEEPIFKEFINSTKNMKAETAKKMLISANRIYKQIYKKPLCFSAEEANYFSTQFRKNITGMYNHTDRYIKTKFFIDEIVLKNDELKKALKKSFSSKELMIDMSDYYTQINRNNYSQTTPDMLIKDYLSATTSLKPEKISEVIDNEINTEKIQIFLQKLEDEFKQYKITFNTKYKYVPDFKTLKNALSEQPNVLVGIAHPLNYASKIRDKSLVFKFFDKFYAKFKNVFEEKALFCETYYQSYSKHAKHLNEKPNTIKHMELLAKKYHLFNTGGLDNHRQNLFSRY